MIVYIDQGNTRAKWAIESEGQVLCSGFDSSNQLISLGENLARYATPGRLKLKAIVANVKGADFFCGLEQALRGFGLKDIKRAEISNQLGGLSILPAYETTLGVDRWLMMLAVWDRHKSASMIVSAGTALTMDIVGGGGEHLGGWVAPGLRVLRSNLSSNTADIEYVEAAGDLGLALGRSTAECVQRGCMSMFLGFIGSALRQYDALVEQKIVCGGDATKIMEYFSGDFVMQESLVIDGLRVYSRLNSSSLWANSDT